MFLGPCRTCAYQRLPGLNRSLPACVLTLRAALALCPRPQLSVSNHAGRALADSPLVVGPTASSANAAADPGPSVRLEFKGAMAAPCTRTDETGAEFVDLCDAGVVTAAAQYYEVGGWPHRGLGVGA